MEKSNQDRKRLCAVRFDGYQVIVPLDESDIEVIADHLGGRDLEIARDNVYRAVRAALIATNPDNAATYRTRHLVQRHWDAYNVCITDITHLLSE